MSNWVYLQRGLSTDRFEPLTWRKGAGPGGLTALVSCSNGHIASLSDHEIAADGTVTPSLACPTDLCNFHESVRLVDWTPDD